MDHNNRIIDMAAARISLIEEFNLVGREGRENWPKLVRYAQAANFSEFDFQRRLHVSKSMLRQWSACAGHPPEEQRESFRRVIVGVLRDRQKKGGPGIIEPQ